MHNSNEFDVAVVGYGPTGQMASILLGEMGYRVAVFYPARLRGTALGFSLRVGRLGAIVGPSYLAAVIVLISNSDAGFYAFMVPALLGALVIAMIPARQRTITPDKAAEATVPKDRERL